MKKLLSLSYLAVVLVLALHSEDMKKDTRTTGEAPPSNAMMSADPAKAVFDLSGLAPRVLAYSSEAAAQAIAGRNRVVYFFAASWCPTCRETYRDIKANAKDIPSDLTIVVVDYDKSAELKTKYGITYQHTFVSLGPKGQKLKVWSGSTKVGDIDKNAVR
jgi:thiol-disulfide isomerase/thioredoxin